MAKNCTVIVLSALCVLSIAGLGQCAGTFELYGQVYCDTCGVSFPTRISSYVMNVEVELKCKNARNDTVTFTTKAKTAEQGFYKLNIPSDHEDAICEVAVISSPDSICNVIDRKISFANFPLHNETNTDNSPRYADPIGVGAKITSPACDEVLQELKLKYYAQLTK